MHIERNMPAEIKKLIPDNPRVLIQGATGKEALRAIPAMRSYGTTVVAGVTPGKGGQTVEGVPVFNTVREAIASEGSVNMVVQFVPPIRALTATEESLEAGIPFILIGAEKVPVHDALRMVKMARAKGALLIGPSSVGMIVPRKGLKLGMIGGDTPTRTFSEGSIAVLSKSGGMTSEIAHLLKKSGLGVSFAAGLGGERIPGTDLADALIILEEDPSTEASIIFGELGGVAEEHVARAVKEGAIKKPVVSFTVGEFVSLLPHAMPFGHTGAMLERGKGGVKEKRALLKEAGVLVAEKFDDIPKLLAGVL